MLDARRHSPLHVMKTGRVQMGARRRRSPPTTTESYHEHSEPPRLQQLVRKQVLQHVKMNRILAKIQLRVPLLEHMCAPVHRPAKQALENAAPIWGRARFRPSNLFSEIGVSGRARDKAKETKTSQHRQRGAQQQLANRNLITRT